jgi:hypothetical protein
VNPLERPETWDLARFRDEHPVALPGSEHRPDAPAEAVEDGATLADRSRPR